MAGDGFGEWDNRCDREQGVQLPRSYFTPSFDFILYPYFCNRIEYNLFYRMYTNYITVLYRAKHEVHGKNREENDEVLCVAKPTVFPAENICLPTQPTGELQLPTSCPKADTKHLPLLTGQQGLPALSSHYSHLHFSQAGKSSRLLSIIITPKLPHTKR